MNNIIHFQPFSDSYNTKCLNGSAHARRTHLIEFVNCPKCLNPDTAKRFWHEHEQKNGNEHKV